MIKTNSAFRGVAMAGLSLLFVNCNDQAPKAQEPDHSMVIEAEIEGLNEEYLTYYEKGDQYPNGLRIDTLWIKDGKFSFTDSTDQYKRYRFAVPQVFKYTDSTKGGYYPTPVMWLDILGYPGADIKVKGTITDFVDAYPQDGSVNDIYTSLNKEIYPLLNKSVNMSVDANMKKMSREEYMKVREAQAEIANEVTAIKEQHIRKNPASPAMAFTLLQSFKRKEFDPEKVKELYAGLSAEALEGVAFYEELTERIQALEGAVAGNMAPEIKTDLTYNGKPFALSDLKGNYVLIDFWGTWCGPCVGEMPKLKEFQEKYSDQNFVILGIDSGDTEERWRKFIEEEGYDWTHIRTAKGGNDLLIPYNVSAFPTKYLIDPNGKIIHKSVGSSEEMFNKIEEIFSEES